jgi:ankyrin repeat protein
MLNLLLDAGADPNIVTSPPTPATTGTMSALAAACSLGHISIIRALLARGAIVDAQLTTTPILRFTGHGLTALHVAVSADKPEAVQVLLSEGGADATATFDGHRAIGTSPPPSNSNSPPTAKPTTLSRPRRHSRVWTTAITSLHLAAAAAAAGDGDNTSSPSCTSLLLRHGAADPEARDGFGRTPLHWAMSGGSVETVHLLLRAGTPVDVVDDDGATPLAALVSQLEAGRSRPGHPDVVRMLLAAGANPDLRYPQELSVRRRLLLMDEWRDVYEGLFERYRR